MYDLVQVENRPTGESTMDIDQKTKVLILCTGNSARSIMAEALFNHFGWRFFEVRSAGSNPTGQVNPLALDCITGFGLNSSTYYSKSWHEFMTIDQSGMDIVLTVCDNAAREVCPLLTGDLLHVHWGYADPAGVDGGIDQARAAFANCFNDMKIRVESLTALQLDHYNRQQTAALMELYAPGNVFEPMLVKDL